MNRFYAYTLCLTFAQACVQFSSNILIEKLTKEQEREKKTLCIVKQSGIDLAA